MSKMLALACALLLAVSAGAAWAGDVEGKVQSMDTNDRVLTLEDGTKLWIAEGVSIEGLKEGAKVKASFEERDGKNVATSVQVSE
jgi:Cu/Ag efflux protein CusF